MSIQWNLFAGALSRWAALLGSLGMESYTNSETLTQLAPQEHEHGPILTKFVSWIVFGVLRLAVVLDAWWVVVCRDQGKKLIEKDVGLCRVVDGWVRPGAGFLKFA